jgi:ABC-type phosphate/phosphonate transport system substrate-binding protein
MIFLLPPPRSQDEAVGDAPFFLATLSAWAGGEIQLDYAESYEEMTERIRAAEVHLCWAPPTVCAQVEEVVPAILKSIRGGYSTYQAALVARAGEVPKIEALPGLKAVWVDPLSSGGYLLARKHLESLDMDPGSLFESQHFAGSYRAALIEVVTRKADVTSVYAHRQNREHVTEILREIVFTAADRLAVVAFTRATPADGLVITRAVDDSLVERISARAESDPPPTLLKTLNVDGFTLALPADYKILR